MTEVPSLEKMLLLGALFSVVATLFVTPYVLHLFRRKVTASMHRNAQADEVFQDEVPASLPPKGLAEHVLPRVPAGAVLRTDANAQALSRRARSKLRRIALAYACGGLAQAAIITMVVIWVTPNSNFLAGVLSIFMVMALPVVSTVAMVLAARMRVRVLWLAVAVLLALAIAGEARALVWVLFQFYILIPGAIFLVLNLRYWRAAAPLIMLLAMGASIGWLVLMEIGSAWGVNSSLMWLFRLVGLAGGIALALPLARRLGSYYQAKRTSELMLFLDIGWLLLTLIQTAILVTLGGPACLLAVLGYVAFWLVRRALIRGLQRQEPPAARLLLLRVFGHDRRTERLLDELSLKWRPLGTVALIAGSDLAYRNIDPRELYGFLTGALSREFIKDENHLAERLSQRDERQDPDGLYRVGQFFCHRNTWKRTLDALVAGSDAVLMDLRGFGPEHAGCQYEIQKLAEHAGSKPMVLLTDSNPGAELAESLFVAAVPQTQRAETLSGGRVFILQAQASLGKTVETAIQLLLGGQVVPAQKTSSGP